MDLEKLMASLLLAASAAHAQPVPADMVRTVGRIAQTERGWLATWPGVHWSLRFAGPALGVRLDDALNHWLLEIDGKTALQIAPQPGERTVWVRGLGPGEHEARLIKRTESSAHAARVVGFELEGGKVLAPPAVQPHIEFIGDSFTAGMGNLSAERRCSNEEIAARSDVSQAYAVLSARALGLDWRVHARSGAGLLRNWAGSRPGQTHGTDYARLLQDREGAPEPEPPARAYVIALGINDYSTPVGPTEARTAAQLDADFERAYLELIGRLRARNPAAPIVLISAPLKQGDRLRPAIARIAAAQQDASLHLLDWGEIAAQGCGGHPDRGDHRQMAARLTALLRKPLP